MFFPGQTMSTLREFMEDDGLAFAYRRFIESAVGPIRFAKALNRSVTGSMNELIAQADARLIEGTTSPYAVGFALNNVLLSSIAPSKEAKYGRPREAFKELIDRCST